MTHVLHFKLILSRSKMQDNFKHVMKLVFNKMCSPNLKMKHLRDIIVQQCTLLLFLLDRAERKQNFVGGGDKQNTFATRQIPAWNFFGRYGPRAFNLVIFSCCTQSAVALGTGFTLFFKWIILLNLQNLTESCGILQNLTGSCKILQDIKV